MRYRVVHALRSLLFDRATGHVWSENHFGVSFLVGQSR